MTDAHRAFAPVACENPIEAAGRRPQGGRPPRERNELQRNRFESGWAYLRRVVATSMTGTVVEWYEFFRYGTAATLVFGNAFFAEGGNALATRSRDGPEPTPLAGGAV